MLPPEELLLDELDDDELLLEDEEEELDELLEATMPEASIITALLLVTETFEFDTDTTTV